MIVPSRGGARAASACITGGKWREGIVWVEIENNRSRVVVLQGESRLLAGIGMASANRNAGVFVLVERRTLNRNTHFTAGTACRYRLEEASLI